MIGTKEQIPRFARYDKTHRWSRVGAAGAKAPLPLVAARNRIPNYDRWEWSLVARKNQWRDV